MPKPQRSTNTSTKSNARKSRKVEMMNLSASEIPEDLGLLPQTFIRPPNRDMPRLFGKSWKARLRTEMMWMKSRLQNFAGVFYIVWWLKRDLPKSERSSLDLQSRPAIALDLHHGFYTHLASGDLRPMRNFLCSGLTDKSRALITHRNENKHPPQTWKIVRYTSALKLPFSFRFFPWPLTSLLPYSQAKIVSDRIAPLPFKAQGKEIIIRQCVVRIRSLQSLDKNDGTPPTQTDLTEYVVLQQFIKDGRHAPWKIWGTTNPTSPLELKQMLDKSVDRDSAKAHNITLLDRFKAAMPTGGLGGGL